MSDRPLGRRTPPDLDHVSSYPLRTLLAQLAAAPAGTEKSLGLPWWWKQHDQGNEGACVGFGSSAMMSITNHYQRLRQGQDVTYRYDARFLYTEAQAVDEWAETPPEEGTSVRASCQILHQSGHKRVQNGVVGPQLLAHGISAYRWAETIDEMRAAIYAGLAISIGVNWYSAFDNVGLKDGERWVGIWGSLGGVRGGHCVCIYRMSDRRQAFMFMNSWGAAYPPVWLSYTVMERLLSEVGEAAVITDR